MTDGVENVTLPQTRRRKLRKLTILCEHYKSLGGSGILEGCGPA